MHNQLQAVVQIMEDEGAATTPTALSGSCCSSGWTEEDRMSPPGPLGIAGSPGQDPIMSAAGQQPEPTIEDTTNLVLGEDSLMPAAEDNPSRTADAQSLRPSCLGKRTLNAELQV